MPDPNPLPESQQVAFVESALYDTFDLEGRDEEALVKFFYGSGTLDAWCPACAKPSVFRIASQLPGYNEPKKNLPHEGLVTITASCPRGSTGSYDGCRQKLYVVFHKLDSVVRKIGQSPSAADIVFGSLDEAFNKELDSAHRRELGTAIGLRAHGVGIGSYVYLRRVFEALLEEAHGLAAKDAPWDEGAYKKARVPERIRLLRVYLPARLVASADLYKILSLGVHELSEAGCLASFPLVKGALELILKERLEAKRYDTVIKELAPKSDAST
jgi:hypothetical protein